MPRLGSDTARKNPNPPPFGTLTANSVWIVVYGKFRNFRGTAWYWFDYYRFRSEKKKGSSRDNNILGYRSGGFPAGTSHSSWNPVLAPTFEEPFGLRLRPIVPEQLLDPLSAKLESGRRISSSMTLDLDHGCSQLQGRMGASVVMHQQRRTAPAQGNPRLP